MKPIKRLNMKTDLRKATGFFLTCFLIFCTAQYASCGKSGGETPAPTPPPEPGNGTKNYYISSSMGSDSNDGLSEKSPWRSLKKINSGQYNPGDSILLRSGDIWSEAVTFTSKFRGSETDPIVISSYGTGTRPKITHPAKDIRVLMLINNADCLTVSNLDFGPFYQYGLRFDITDGKEHGHITVENVHVHDMKLAGIFFKAQDTPGYRNVAVRRCTGNNVEMMLAVGGCKEVHISDCEATECLYGGFSIMSVEGGEMSGCKVFRNGTGDYPNGACGIYLGSTKDFTVRNCEVAFQKRYGTNPDAEALDFECNNVNVTVADCYFHDNDGCAIMFYDNRRGLVNKACVVENCRFENNGRNWHDPRGFEIHFTKINNNNDGIIRNNTFSLRPDLGFLTTVDPSVTVTGNKTADGEPLSIAPPLDGQPKLLNGGFEAPAVQNHSRIPAGASWTFRGGGIARNGSDFGAPAAPQGTQVVFLQGVSNVSQCVTFAGGTYKLCFRLAYRNRGEATEQGLTVLIDNVQQGGEILPGPMFDEYESVPFTVEAGARLIELRSSREGDKTIFVDDVRIVPVE